MTRLVSAATFGGAAALTIAVLVVALGSGTPGPMTERLYWVPFALAASAALAGFAAGPRVAAAPSAGAAALLGVGVTLASAVVYLVGVWAVVYAVDVAAGRLSDTGIGDLLSAELWGIAFVVALVFSPVGALAAWAFWRRARTAARPGETFPRAASDRGGRP